MIFGHGIHKKSALGLGNFQGVLPDAPADPQPGWTYINSTDDGYYIYYCGSWQLITQLVCGEESFLLLEDGTPILLENGTGILLE